MKQSIGSQAKLPFEEVRPCVTCTRFGSEFQTNYGRFASCSEPKRFLRVDGFCKTIGLVEAAVKSMKFHEKSYRDSDPFSKKREFSHKFGSEAVLNSRPCCF
ncbi:hypothetical protein NPIL_47681 [Nephila pilipes]|uniref:Uncharacterized protein n=1 Tax=Nephila pilipes TaxID=299642 RepID=A0A8X6PEH9_NEPPI|nr:hypothetical protein NPIL_47681 [Nephila pilipes]